MVVKKAYASPAIVTEDLLEQTSLACNSTSSGSIIGLADSEDCFQVSIPGTFAPGVEMACNVSVAKGGAYADDVICTTVLNDLPDIVVLS